jgi:hypothetical protein
LLAALAACSEDEGGARVYDAVVIATDRVLRQIDDEPSFKKAVDNGTDIGGTVEEGGGKITVSGWRDKRTHENAAGAHTLFGERLTMTLVGFSANDVKLDGTLVLSRHQIDLGPAGGTVEAASRMTAYQGTLGATGAASGKFELEVHVFATGQTQWSCGFVNEEPQGVGVCY